MLLNRQEMTQRANIVYNIMKSASGHRMQYKPGAVLFAKLMYDIQKLKMEYEH